MEDERIIELFWARAEEAISAAAQKYGAYCHTVAYNILYSQQDAEECVNDTYLRAWGAMPPHRPSRLAAFLGKITRNLALDAYKKQDAQKRGGGQMALALAELEECIPAPQRVAEEAEEGLLTGYMQEFLEVQSPEKRKVFLLRYWYVQPIAKICRQTGLTESKITTLLFRMRRDLKQYLEEKGVTV